MMNQNVGGIFDQMRARRLNEECEEVKAAPEATAEPEATPATEATAEPEATAVDMEEIIVEVEGVGEVELAEEEMNEAVKKVVRGGEVVTKKVSTHKKRLTAEQKKALAQARKKAHTASANKERAKSMKKRKSMNMEEVLTCPECSFEGDEDEFDEEDGKLYCPECGAEVTCDGDEGCKKNEEVDVAELAVRLDECEGSEYMKRALNMGKYDMVQKYLAIKEGE